MKKIIVLLIILVIFLYFNNSKKEKLKLLAKNDKDIIREYVEDKFEIYKLS